MFRRIYVEIFNAQKQLKKGGREKHSRGGSVFCVGYLSELVQMSWREMERVVWFVIVVYVHFEYLKMEISQAKGREMDRTESRWRIFHSTKFYIFHTCLCVWMLVRNMWPPRNGQKDGKKIDETATEEFLLFLHFQSGVYVKYTCWTLIMYTIFSLSIIIFIVITANTRCLPFATHIRAAAPFNGWEWDWLFFLFWIYLRTFLAGFVDIRS